MTVTGYTAGLGSSFPVKYQTNPHAGCGTACTSPCALRFAPNPASNYIQFSSTENGQFKSTQIYNSSVQPVFQSSAMEELHKINISSFQPGLYLMKTQDYYGNFQDEKFIKN